MSGAERSPAGLRVARAEVSAALARIAAAQDALRRHGWPENAADLGRSYGHLAVWTVPGGWFDALEADDG